MKIPGNVYGFILAGVLLGGLFLMGLVGVWQVDSRSGASPGKGHRHGISHQVERKRNGYQGSFSGGFSFF